MFTCIKPILAAYGIKGEDFEKFPGVNGIGIIEDALLFYYYYYITTAFDDPAQDQIPDELTGSFEGLPVIVLEVGEPEHCFYFHTPG